VVIALISYDKYLKTQSLIIKKKSEFKQYVLLAWVNYSKLESCPAREVQYTVVNIWSGSKKLRCCVELHAIWSMQRVPKTPPKKDSSLMCCHGIIKNPFTCLHLQCFDSTDAKLFEGSKTCGQFSIINVLTSFWPSLVVIGCINLGELCQIAEHVFFKQPTMPCWAGGWLRDTPKVPKKLQKLLLLLLLFLFLFFLCNSQTYIQKNQHSAVVSNLVNP